MYEFTALKSLLLSARLIFQLPFVGHGFWSAHSEWTFGGCNLELAYHQPLVLSERHRCRSIGLISATTQLRFEWLHRHGTSVPQRDNVITTVVDTFSNSHRRCAMCISKITFASFTIAVSQIMLK